MPLTALKPDPSVIGVRAVGEHALEVVLSEPTPYFVQLVMYQNYAPVRRAVIERFEAMGKPDHWYRPGNIVTNGPYVLDEHKFRYEITFKPNPRWYAADQLKLKRIVWLEVEPYHSTMNLYKTGEIDWIGQVSALPAAYMDVLEGYDDFSREWWLSTYWYEFNTKAKPVDDVRVRRALNLAVDKQQLIDRVTYANQMPATHYVPPFTGSGYSEAHEADAKAGRDPFSGAGHDFDPERARKLLSEAGYQLVQEGDGWKAKNFPSLEILYNTSEGHRKIAVAIQDMWKRHLGISVQLRNEEWKVMIKNLRDGNFQLARFGWTGDYNHPHTWMDTFLSYSANNFTNHENPAFDALVAKAASEANPQESIRLYREAEALIAADMCRLPLYFYTKSTLVKPHLKGYWGNAQNRHFVRWMWIDEDWRNNPENTPAFPPEALPTAGAY